MAMLSTASTIFGSPLISSPKPSLFSLPKTESATTGYGLKMIECSSRPQKKATAHHRKTRPRKSQPWDIKRKPTVYPPLPPMPCEWTLVSSAAAAGGGAESDGGGADDDGGVSVVETLVSTPL